MQERNCPKQPPPLHRPNLKRMKDIRMKQQQVRKKYSWGKNLHESTASARRRCPILAVRLHIILMLVLAHLGLRKVIQPHSHPFSYVREKTWEQN